MEGICATPGVPVAMEDFEQLDYYALLGVDRSASAEDIKRAYRQQMTRYHPDRYANATPAEQAYASQRAQRINEAYRVLSDFNARSAYNRGLPAPGSRRMSRTTDASGGAASGGVQTPPRDHQAELYEQANAHLAAGRYVQAIATLRQLQQINPFYRDSATLLAQAEAAVREQTSAARPARPVAAAPSERAQPNRTRRRLIAGGLGGVAMAGLIFAGLWLRQNQTITASVPPTTVVVPSSAASPDAVALASPPAALPTAVAPTAPVPTQPLPSSTAVPPSPTAVPPSPTAVPPSPTAAPPNATPPPSPTRATPTPEVVAERGPLILSDDFSGQNWANVEGSTWSVGNSNGSYRITTRVGSGNIWSYNTAPSEPDFSVGVNVQVQGGAAGLLLHYTDRANYLAFFVDPVERSYWLERRVGGQVATLVEGSSPAIVSRDATSNRLVARLDNSTIQLFINNSLADEVTISDLSRSQLYGMIAVARTGNTVALFDDLEIRELE